MKCKNDFERALFDIQDRSYEQLVEDMIYLEYDHIEILEKLKQGPLPYRYDCGICHAFGDKSFLDNMTFDPDNYLWRIWAYHEVPKLKMRFADQLHHGYLSNETYIRCFDTYKAAGWSGVMDEPNA